VGSSRLVSLLKKSNAAEGAPEFFCFAMYLILSSLLAFFGVQVIFIISTETVQISFLKRKTELSILTVILILTFISRSIKDLLSGLKIGQSDISHNPVLEPIGTQALYFSLMLVWELIPAGLVIGLFLDDSRPSTQGPISEANGNQ